MRQQSIVIIIPKPGKDVINPVNHRPISLLNTMSKSLEKLAHQTQNPHHLQNTSRPTWLKKIPQHYHQLLKVIDDISLNLNKRRITSAILLVIEKSFDEVRSVDDHISKLIDLGVPSAIIIILTSLRIDTSRLKTKTKHLPIYLS